MNSYPRLLVVDDDENDLRMVAGVLSHSDDPSYVSFAHDGVEALDFIYRRGTHAQRPPGVPGLVLLDLHMPLVNGWEVLRQVKADEQLASIPIIIFSSSARECDVEQSYALGANAYVVKPIDFLLFQQTIRAIETFWLNCNQPAPQSMAPVVAIQPRRLRQPRRPPLQSESA